MANEYEVDYTDERLQSVKNEETTKLNEINNRYDSMINNTDNYYNQLIQNSKDWANKQTNLQDEQTNQLVNEINQQQDKAQKDYEKEQKASYVDYKKQTDEYGIKAEQNAMNGLQNSGYSESSKVAMFNAYQNRIGVAREGINTAVLNFQNSINEAKISNSVTKAEIAEKAADEQLNLALQGFQYKNNLIETKQNAIANNSDRFKSYYQQVLDQINQEIENKKWLEEIRMQKEELTMNKAQTLKQMDYITAQINHLNAQTGKIKTESSVVPEFGDDGNSNNETPTKTVELSDNAQKVKIAANTVGNKEIAGNIVYKQYMNKIITKEEADTICQELGL